VQQGKQQEQYFLAAAAAAAAAAARGDMAQAMGAGGLVSGPIAKDAGLTGCWLPNA